MCVLAQLHPGEEFATKEDLRVLISRIQSQDAKIQSQETKIQSLEAQLKAKQDRTTLISFRAGFVHDPVPLKFSNGQIVIFDKVYLNDGNAYIAHSGMFHAPVSGLYIFTLHVLPSSSEMEFSIIKDGTPVAYMVSTSSGGTESIQTVIHLHKGQEVWIVKHWGGDTLRGYQLTTFSGFLLRTDDDNTLVSNGGSLVVG
ncbi:complement C1q tumor necrosis factor-related protein 3-like [Gigantopelta aegis]|uniref:complement C1q tumor necrosis factor-related protein 3-like n=1 Tax=Gigantopelta aegis TaxID=1735272 RepID=UPI001B88D684|nr:complement C1q tumor necrosis factor-related protein 3-like [Gigantopelta aegis]